MIAHRALRQLKFQCTSADNNDTHYATSPAFLLTNQTAFLHVEPEHLMTNSADKNKKPGPQRCDSTQVAQPADRIGQFVFALPTSCNKYLAIWGFATMSCWATNSVESELDLREFHSCTSSCVSPLGHFRSGQKVWCCRDQNYISQVSSRQNIKFYSFFCQELYVLSHAFTQFFILWFTSLSPFLSWSFCFGFEIRYIAVLTAGSLCACTPTKPTRMACVQDSSAQIILLRIRKECGWTRVFHKVSHYITQGPEEATKRFQQIQEAYSARLWDGAWGVNSQIETAYSRPIRLLVEFCIADYCNRKIYCILHILDYVYTDCNNHSYLKHWLTPGDVKGKMHWQVFMVTPLIEDEGRWMDSCSQKDDHPLHCSGLYCIAC